MNTTATMPAVAGPTDEASQAAPRRQAGDSPQTGSSSPASVGESRVLVLSRQLFLKHLELEKRRTDRTKAPLSLIVATVDPAAGGIEAVQAALDMFSASKRETDLLGQLDADRIGVLLPHTSIEGARAYLANIRAQCALLPLELHAAAYPDDLFEHVLKDPTTTTVPMEYIAGSSFKHGIASVIAKRTLDIVGAVTGIVLLSPIMLATAVAVAVSSPGPVIFRQGRLGKGGKPFVFLKFRSMRTNNDDKAHREYVASLIEGRLDEINQGDADKPLYKMTVDPRITPVGRFIRKTSLDELPQLFNVLKGEMSLVGPRPPLPYEADKYQAWHLRRILEIQPGITGLWQVEGRSTTSFDDMVRLDLRYAKTRTFWLDLKIILRTVLVLFGSRGAA
jgi:lipopolysaccharide/colanic/teichoic acid biosynthesis glycosyltransferase